MKKTIAIMMSAMLAVLSLCGCGKRPISEAELDKLIGRMRRRDASATPFALFHHVFPQAMDVAVFADDHPFL